MGVVCENNIVSILDRKHVSLQNKHKISRRYDHLHSKGEDMTFPCYYHPQI